MSTNRTTLPNLMDRARLAINCLTQLCDKSRGNIPYFYTRISDRPLSAILAIWSYGDGLGRTVDALTLLRAMTGDNIEHIEDKTMRATLISFLGHDDLSWCPAEPWLFDVAHTRPAWLQHGTLMALISLWQFTNDDQYLDLAKKNILAVRKMAQFHENYADFPGEYYTLRDGWHKGVDDSIHRQSVFNTSVTMPLMKFYSLTGFEPALDLASNLIAWALKDHGGADGLFKQGHFHSYGRLLVAIILRGVTTKNQSDIQLGVQLFNKALTLGTQSGWFPEQIDSPEHNRENLSETCCLTDMFEAAILLAQNVDPSYWHHVERWANNHLLVHQIIDSDWFDQTTFVEHEKHVLGFNCQNKIDIDGVLEGDSIRQKLLGGYAGWGAVTAMSDDSMFSNSNQHCCNAAGARGLYDVWRYAVTDSRPQFRVNLHISRKHAAADVTVSLSPEQAFLNIRVDQPREVLVRLPEFVQAQELAVTINGKTGTLNQKDAYVSLGNLKPGDTIELSYPRKSRQTKEKVASNVFTFNWRGSCVVNAEPIQKIRPLFVESRFESVRRHRDISLPTKEIDSI